MSCQVKLAPDQSGKCFRQVVVMICSSIPNFPRCIYNYLSLPYMPRLLPFFILLSCHLLNSGNLRAAQSVDSLKTKMSEQDGVDRLDTMLELIELYASSEPDSAFKYGRKALRIAKKYDLDYQVAKSLWLLGIGKRTIRDADSSGYFFEQALEIVKDEELRADISMGIGGLDYASSKLDAALESFLSAATIFEKTGNRKRLGAAYSNIGMIMNANDSDEKALFYFRKSLSIYREYNLKNTMLPTLVNMATLFQKNQDFDSAIFYAQECYNISEAESSSFGMAKSLAVLSESYTHSGEYEKGITLSIQGRELFESMGIPRLAMNMRRLEAVALQKLRKYDEALLIAHEVEQQDYYSTELEKEHIYLLLHDLYELRGNNRKALQYHHKYFVAYQDFIKHEKDALLTEMEVNFDTQEKERKLIELTQQNEIQAMRTSNFVTVSILVILSILLASLVLIFYYQRRLIKQKEQTATHKQQLLRSQMNPHFIFNALTSIRGFLFEKHDLKEAVGYLGKFAKLMRLVLEHSSREWVTLKEEIDALEIYMEIQKMRFNNGFNYTLSIDPTIDPDQIKVPPLLAQPFIENAIEHGFKNIPYEGKVEFSCKSEGDLIRFSIIDNGIGIDHVTTEKEHGSKALLIFKERIGILAKSLKMSLSFIIKDVGKSSSTTGTQIEYTLPANWNHV